MSLGTLRGNDFERKLGFKTIFNKLSKKTGQHMLLLFPDGLLLPILSYSHLFNKRGAWNKRGGGAKFTKLLNVELGINVEGGIFGKN